MATRVTLRCYYKAAVGLGRLHRARLIALFGLQPELPELFAAELGLNSESDPQHQLPLLAEHQQAFSGRRLNWRGTYEHAAERFLTHLERQMETALLQARTFDTLTLADSPATLAGG